MYQMVERLPTYVNTEVRYAEYLFKIDGICGYTPQRLLGSKNLPNLVVCVFRPVCLFQQASFVCLQSLIPR